ncbi:acetyltransferase family protein [Trichonephila inaurata madagascariensis]|uniref:Acetyltransferase family protein n=1 Tax=Trichonephila inaurata madagascariensis TaxID=2747483 RepID=A0A8X6XL62_9ARAC|nr:acetyltransferase family protein [Trichonephila inaurata madagascariensis]
MEEIFKLKSLPFVWWFEEDNLSSEMLERFQNGKYVDFGDVPGMAYNLKDYHEQTIDSKNIKIITEIEEYKKWVQVLAQGFGFSDDVFDIYINKLSKFIRYNKTFIPLAAYEENKMVATASIVFANGIAGFYNGSTMLATEVK